MSKKSMLAILEMDKPGGIEHLPFEWQEIPGEIRMNKQPKPPIVNYLIRYPWLVLKPLSHDISK
ncbi:hypothetical protein IIC38_06350 [candidate division KSB1 bacterium]|nr:hypothetical protein [candidate division KSB1 bacterium]